MTRSWLAALALVPLLGCSSKVVSISVTVLTETCGAVHAAATPDHYRAVISAADIDPITMNFAAGGAVAFDQIPPGLARTLAITGYKGDPTGTGAVVETFGQSKPFDVPSDPSQAVSVTILLKPAGLFAGVPTIANAKICSSLTAPRAGHTATLLSDGRVLIAGGFSLRGDGGAINLPGDGGTVPYTDLVYSDTAEIFDPATNTTKSVAKIFDTSHTGSNNISVAFHTATLLPSGQVLLAGGEDFEVGKLEARPNAMIYDPASDTWVGTAMDAPELDAIDAGGQINRSHHTAAVDSSGRVVILGGVNYLNNDPTQPELVYQTLWFDPVTNTFHALLDNNGADAGALVGSNFSYGREGAEAVSILGGEAILGIGGDQFMGPVDPEIAILIPMPDGGSYWHFKDELSSTLVPPRTGAGVATLGTDQQKVIVAGGIGADGIETVTSIVDAVDADWNVALNTTTPQAADPCAAMLTDGRTMVVGGELDPVGHVTSNHADLYVRAGDGGSGKPTGNLLASRFLHTCTALQDGSLLVTGGVTEQDGSYQVLSTMELYTPVPLQ